MAIRVTCPSCDESFSVSDSLRGKKTKCKECDTPFTVPAGKSKGNPDEEGIIEKKSRAAVKPPKRLRDEEDEDEDEDEDDEEESPRRRGKNKKKGSSAGMLIAIGGGVALVVGVVLFFVLGGGGGSQNNQVAQNENNNAAPPNPQTTNPPGVNPENPPTNPTTPPVQTTNPETKPVPTPLPKVDDTPKTTPVNNPGPMPEVVVGGPLSGEKVYQRMLKSTVWIVAPQNAGLKIPKKNPTPQPPVDNTNPPVQPEPNPQPQQPAPQDQGLTLAGSVWAGSETLPGYGRLRFTFTDASNVTMLDVKDTLAGSYALNGNSVTLNFPGNVVYSGMVNGALMSGTATNTKDNWTWQVTKQGAGVNPNQGNNPGINPNFPKGKFKPKTFSDDQNTDSRQPMLLQAPKIDPGKLPVNPNNPMNPNAGGQAPGIQPNQKPINPMNPNAGGQAPGIQPNQKPVNPNTGQAPGIQPNPMNPNNPGPMPMDPSDPKGGNPNPKDPSIDDFIYTKISTGSGCLVDRKHRLVITNVHVVGNPAALKIHFAEFDGNGDMIAKRESYMKKPGISGRVVMMEPRADLALVQLDSLPAWVQALPISKSKPAVAGQVHSVGNPGASPALFIYSPGKVRQVFHDKWTISGDNYDAMILETDSPINPGDSGGPLVNERGSMVGVAHANIKSAQISMFIEASEVRALMEKYFKSINETWVPEPESVGAAVNVTQMTDWIKKLADKDVAVRVQAAQFLGNLGSEGTLAFSPLFKALKDDEELVRRAAGDAIEKVTPHKGDLTLLSTACKDEAEPMDVRLQSVKALARMGPLGKSAVPHLLVVAKSGDDGLKRAALESLVSIGPDPNNVSDLMKLMKGANGATRRLLLEAFAKLGANAKDAAPQVALLAKNADKPTRMQAMQTLQALGSNAKEVTAPLIDATKDSDKELGVHAALTLAKLGEGKGMVTFLKTQLKSGTEDIKLTALKALGECGPDAKGAAIELANALEDDKLRDPALDVLVKIGKPAANTAAQKLHFLVQGQAHPKARLACLAMLARHPQGISPKENFYILNVLQFTFQSDQVLENKLIAAAILKKVTGKTPQLNPQAGQ